MENRGGADDVDIVKDSSGDGIKKDVFAEEFPSDLPSLSMSSPYSSLPSPSAAMVDDHDDRYKSHANVSGTKKLEHAPPSEPIHLAGLGMVEVDDLDDRDNCHGSVMGTTTLDHAPPSEPTPSTGVGMAKSKKRHLVVSGRNHAVAPGSHGSDGGTTTMYHAHSEPTPSTGVGMAKSKRRHPVVSGRNHAVAPGAYPVRTPRSTAANRTFTSPMTSYDPPRDVANEESQQEEGMTNSEGVHTSAHDTRSVATDGGLYTVEAHRVPDRKEDEIVIVAEAEYVSMKWYQRPVKRWIFLGSSLFACGLLAVVVVLVVGQPSAASSSSSSTPPTTVPSIGAPPTPAPTSLTPELVACNFLSTSDVTKCRLTFEFDSLTNADDKSTGSTIPSEIGLLTQLTHLDFFNNSLTSTIPSEIGLLTQLTYLSFSRNSLTSTIPSEIGRLKNLTLLAFGNNSLTSTIPSEIGLLTQMFFLVFSNNTLTGTISMSLCSLPWLELLFIDCGEITCASGCCDDYDTVSSCG